jgi:hypothetical protein
MRLFLVRSVSGERQQSSAFLFDVLFFLLLDIPCPLSAVCVWTRMSTYRAALLSGGKRRGDGDMGLRAGGSSGLQQQESPAVSAAIAENSPSVLEAYLAWRLAWAVAEAEEAEGEEVEDGWEEMQAEREAEDGTQGETRLAGRIAQSCAAHSLPLLAQLLEATVVAANDPGGGLGMGHLPAALDVGRFGLAAEEAAAARQEQLCSVVEVVAAALTGRPRLTGQLGQGGRPSVPAELAAAASGDVGAGPLLGLVDGLLTISEGIMVTTTAAALRSLPALPALPAKQLLSYLSRDCHESRQARGS